MKIRNFHGLLSVFFLIFGCGVEIGNPGDSNPTPQPKVVENEDVLTLTAEDQYSEVITSATDIFDSRAIALTLIQDGFDRTFNCEESGNDAIVTKNLSGELTFNKGIGARSRTITESISKTSIATWSSSNAIPCNATTNRAQIAWSTIDSVDLTVTNSAQKETTVVRDSDSLTISNKLVTNEGRRSITLTRNNGIIQESITYQTTRTLTYERINSSGSFSHNIQVVEGLPIITNKEFSNNQLVSLTIESGTIQSTFNDGSRVVSSYENLVFDSDSCVPSAGEISGAVYDSEDSSDPSSTFIIGFLNGEANISYDQGPEQDFEIERCAFN